MAELIDDITTLVSSSDFSGVMRVEIGDTEPIELAAGMADRRHRAPNTVDTRFALASGAKSFTATTAMSLVESGELSLATTARELLGTDLALIDDRVTVGHLLAHRSGIGDYLDEDKFDIDDYVMPVPVHQLADAEEYLAVLDGYPQTFEPDDHSAYCNGGYVVLALLIERAAGRPYHELVDERVCRAAGLHDTAFLRSDELPSRAAVGYLSADGLRTNVLHLPVRGVGDGGTYSTLDDIHRLWRAFMAGAIVSHATVELMTTPHPSDGAATECYGLGIGLRPRSGSLFFEGCDAGVSFRSVHQPSTGTTATVMSNTSAGAWPIVERLTELLEL